MRITAKKSGYSRVFVIAAASLATLLLLVILNISLGSIPVPVEETIKVLLGMDADETYRSILWKIRLPRMTAGILLGGALALAGYLLQTFFNNPIAGPYVLGISSGAKLAVACLLMAALGRHGGVGSAALIFAAFVGALFSMGFVLLVSRRVRRASMLIVAGVMVGYICSAITDFVITFADDSSIVNLHNWSRGSFSGASWEDVRIMAAVVLIASLIIFFMAKPLGAYQMGEEYAQNMGLNIKLFRASLVVLSSVLAACVTAFAGPVSFVGIAAPHLVKAFLKTAKPMIVIPLCFLGGAIFCLACDLMARVVFAPTEVSISSVTAVFGAPVVIAIMLGRRAAP
ncbi:MAG: iron ABC transporter permease [Clostridiales bacterium]|jgi:iron complex transport system permease protein|nr:iron ABC transporter permease [Clostridiales bacterium]